MARRTKQDAQATREALLDAAERVFEQRGVSRTSLAHIAEAAGLTRGAVYWHFKDKADLFNAMMERVTLPLESELAGVYQAPGDPIDVLVTRLLHSFGQIATDARTQRVLNIAVMLVEHVEDLWPVRERHAQMDRANVERMRLVFERASALRQQPLPADAQVLAEGFHALVRGLSTAGCCSAALTCRARRVSPWRPTSPASACRASGRRCPRPQRNRG